VVVAIHIAVEVGLGPTNLQFLNRAYLSQQLQVTVDRAQADLGQAASDEFVKLDRSRMRGELPKLLTNDLALPGVSLEFGLCHDWPLSLMIIIIDKWPQSSPFAPKC
jgi:hypothetical protein